MRAGPRGLAHLDERRLAGQFGTGSAWGENCGSRQVLVLAALFCVVNERRGVT